MPSIPLPTFRSTVAGIALLAAPVTAATAAVAQPAPTAAVEAAPFESFGEGIGESLQRLHATEVAAADAGAIQPAPPPAEPVEPELFATVAGVELVEPHPATLPGFHEVNTRQLTLEPTGVLQGNHNPGKAQAPADRSAGPDYLILPTRGRPGTGTSAVDLAVPKGEPVTAVTTGEVVAANAYVLYGSVNDDLVHIRPDANADIVVAMVHLDGLRVQPGDRVVAGETVVADAARALPFGSQIDRYTADARPHVHVQVQPA